jgi:hypothetical protein
LSFVSSPLRNAKSGIIDRGEPFEVQMLQSTLSSVSDLALLNGANLLAIGDGSLSTWELIQFRDAELIAPDRYLLSHRLRGQLGSDGLVPDVWPVGSWCVLMNGVPSQIDMQRNLRRIAQTYRIGPARRSYDDLSYEEFIHAFDGNGLRPYAPAHLKVAADADGLRFDYIRRTRIDGDSWDLAEVPLGEESEAYTVTVTQSNQLLREVTVTEPNWTYTATKRLEDGVSGIFEVSVAQNSARFGPGLYATVTINA